MTPSTTITNDNHRAIGVLKSRRKPLEIALPPTDLEHSQDEEWVVVRTPDQGWKKIRLHDYADVYAIPGLYERWVYEIFRCQSPQKIRAMLGGALRSAGVDPASLNVLDLGAGNGFVAEELRKIGIERFIGVDIHQEAAIAAERDRPGVYHTYIVDDLTDLTPRSEARLSGEAITAMTCVAALGFGDIPPEVFVEAFNRVEDGGWVAFTIKKDFLNEEDESGFSSLIRRMISMGILNVVEQESYVHRVDARGEKLVYAAIVGQKTGPCL